MDMRGQYPIDMLLGIWKSGMISKEEYLFHVGLWGVLVVWDEVALDV